MLSSLLVKAVDEEKSSSTNAPVVQPRQAPVGLLPYIGLAVAPEIYVALLAAYGLSLLIRYGITKKTTDSSKIMLIYDSSKRLNIEQKII